MTGEPRGEFELIDALRARFGTGRDGVVLGIGDDGAVLSAPPGDELVVTTDLLVETRHFVLGDDPTDAEAVGWKSLAVSVSDLAAMGARARWAVVSVALRPEQTGATADALAAGLHACAERYGVAIVGGDTTGSPGPVVVNVALIGTVRAGCAVRRSGARPGDAVCVTGALGGSLLGRHLRPTPRQDEALSLVQAGVVHAMIDLSDGLSSDLGHVLDASGVGAELWADRVPIHPDAELRAADSGRAALDHALHDGEDFELLFTVDEDAAEGLVADGIGGTPVAQIGRIRAAPGLEIAASQGAAGERLERRGHDHFRSA